MLRFVSVLAAALLAASATPAAAQTTLGFYDEIWSDGDLCVELFNGCVSFTMPNGYGGLNWTGFQSVGTQVTEGNQYPGMFDAGHQGFATTSGGSITGPWFALHGGWFGTETRDGVTLTVTGYRNGNVAYVQNYIINALTPSYLTFNFKHVDLVSFVASGGTTTHPLFQNPDGSFYDGQSISMDDLSVTVTPEPVSMALLGTGLLGLAAIKRRKRNKKQ